MVIAFGGGGGTIGVDNGGEEEVKGGLNSGDVRGKGTRGGDNGEV